MNQLVDSDALSDAVRGRATQSGILALPVCPVILPTPVLLRVLLPRVASQQIVSFDLLLYYEAALGMLAIKFGTHPLQADVAGHLNREKWNLRFGPPAEDEPRTLAYVHACERALIKYMYLSKIDDPAVLRAVVRMNEATEASLEVRTWLCDRFPSGTTPTLDATVAARREALAEAQVKATLNQKNEKDSGMDRRRIQGDAKQDAYEETVAALATVRIGTHDGCSLPTE